MPAGQHRQLGRDGRRAGAALEQRGIQETPSSKSVPKRKAGSAKDAYRVLNDLLGGMPDEVTVGPERLSTAALGPPTD